MLLGIPQAADRVRRHPPLTTAIEKGIRRPGPCLQPPGPTPDLAPGAEHEQPVVARSEGNARARWQQILPLYAQGMKIDTISQITGYDRTTVRRYVRAPRWLRG